MMVDDRIARINAVTPYYCPNGGICQGKCKFGPCPNAPSDAASLVPAQWWWPTRGPFEGGRWLPPEPFQTLHIDKPRIRVKAGSRKLPAGAGL